ncbi:MAG: HAMP domain-containing histidine kinase [Desulfobacterales bacterium]|nr:HAMP domain-containing histidine kinase [Desulfobacterales bacterium]
MKNLLGIGSNGNIASDILINPSFQKLLSIQQNEERIFQGILTIKNNQKNISQSIYASCFRKNNEILIHGEYDINEYTYMNQKMISMNRDMNNFQRELIKEKTLLENTLNELKQTQNQLIQSEKMASLGRMVAGFAHEINTPIGVAITASSSMYDTQENIFKMLNQEEVEEDTLVQELKDLREASLLILKNLRRAGELVKSFKRTSINQSSDIVSLFSMYDIINDVIVSLNSIFKKTEIKIDFKCPLTLHIYSFPGAISQIITNLIMNSFYYGFKNGTLPGMITINVRKESQIIYIEFKDTGLGMDEKTQAKIFEPFFTTGRDIGGTGLGLFICYNITKNQLKGDISCHSSKGQGAIFNIQFPVERIDTL